MFLAFLIYCFFFCLNVLLCDYYYPSPLIVINSKRLHKESFITDSDYSAGERAMLTIGSFLTFNIILYKISKLSKREKELRKQLSRSNPDELKIERLVKDVK